MYMLTYICTECINFLFLDMELKMLTSTRKTSLFYILINEKNLVKFLDFS